MKTSLACLALLITTLLIGRWQGSRIEKFQHRIDHTQSLRKMKASARADQERPSGYRTKYERKSHGTTAAKTLEVLISIPRPKTGASLEPAAATENREAMQAITQLDLPGLEELMMLIANSKDPALQFPYGQEKAILCLVAMADLNPRRALANLLEGKDWQRFSEHEHVDDKMLKYVLARMGEGDPQGSLRAILQINKDSPEKMSGLSVDELLGTIARQDPGLVLEALDQLPVAKKEGVLDAFSYKLESYDQRTALFLAMRDHYRSQPQGMKDALTPLCQMFSYNGNLPAESRRWADDLGMTDAEKLLMADGLKRIIIQSVDGEDYTRWFAAFMPESPERIELIWKASREWAASESVTSEPVRCHAFLKEQGIDAESMMRHEME